MINGVRLDQRLPKCTSASGTQPSEVRAIDQANRPHSERQFGLSAGRTPHPVFWVIAIALVVIATTLVTRPDGPSWPPDLIDSAMGQPVTSAGARGVFAFTGQLTKSTFGVYLVDVDAMTMWTYEYEPARGCLRLASARTWRYDRYLEDYNTCNLSPAEVEKMIENQRAYRLQSSENDMP